MTAGNVALGIGIVVILPVVASLASRYQRKPSRAGTQGSQARGTVLRLIPWIEIILGGSIALLLYFVLQRHELAEFFAIASMLLALGRLTYTSELEKAIGELKMTLKEVQEPLERIGEFLDVSAQANFPVFRDMLQVYAKITELEFGPVKDEILGNARSKMLDLANDKRSETLATTAYYKWLLP